MQFLELIIPLIISLIISRIIYGIFEKSGFFGVVTFKMTLEVILLIVSLILNKIPFSLATILIFFLGLIGSFIPILISTSIENWAYNKSNSFFTFILFNILIAIIISIGLIVIFFCIMCFINPVLLSNEIIKLILLIILIFIVVIIIYLVIKGIERNKLKKIVNERLKNNSIIINSEISKENKSNSFCSNCGLQLSDNVNYCMRCGQYINKKTN